MHGPVNGSVIIHKLYYNFYSYEWFGGLYETEAYNFLFVVIGVAMRMRKERMRIESILKCSNYFDIEYSLS